MGADYQTLHQQGRARRERWREDAHRAFRDEEDEEIEAHRASPFTRETRHVFSGGVDVIPGWPINPRQEGAHPTCAWCSSYPCRCYMRARGAIEWQPGDEKPEDVIRRLRGDDDALRERALRAEQRVRDLEESQGELLGLIFPRCAECLEAIEPTEQAVPGASHGGRLVHAECA